MNAIIHRKKDRNKQTDRQTEDTYT